MEYNNLFKTDLTFNRSIRSLPLSMQIPSQIISELNQTLLSVGLGTAILCGLFILKLGWKAHKILAQFQIKIVAFDQMCEEVHDMKTNHLAHIEQSSAEALEVAREQLEATKALTEKFSKVLEDNFREIRSMVLIAKT